MSLKIAVKRLAHAAAPRLAAAISAHRARRRSHRLLKEWGLWNLNQRLIAEFGSQVLDGRDMFARTHAAQVVDTRSETPLNVRPASFTDEEMRRVSAEARGPQQWLVLTPFTTAAAGA
jgi:hypothetical protein